MIPFSGITGQTISDTGSGPSATNAAHVGSTVPLSFHGSPLFTGVSVWAGSSFDVRTANDNQQFNGHFRIVGVQFLRSLFAWKGTQFSWIIEVLPVITATVSAPNNRTPTLFRNPEAYADPTRFALYLPHSVFGVGLAPFSAQAVRPLSNRLTALWQVTSGGAVFSKVIPYGLATRANFTASTSFGVEYNLSPKVAIAVGYDLHHLSNASFGQSNPGMNSHILFVRFARARFDGVAR